MSEDELNALTLSMNLWTFDHETKQPKQITKFVDNLVLLHDKASGKFDLAKCIIRDALVSTIFLPSPISSMFFETMVLGGPMDGRQERHATYEEAMACHDKIIKELTEDSKESLRFADFKDWNNADSESN